MLDKNTVDLFVFSGQSNMQGQTEPLKDDYAETASAYEYRHLSNQSYITSKHPCGENYENNSFLAAHQGYGSLPPYFAREYVKHGKLPLIVHAAKGATVINEWQPDTQRYKDLINKINGAERNIGKINKSIINKAMLWCQGESDGIIGTSRDEYKKLFLNFWNEVKKDTELKNCYIIRIAKFSDMKKDAVIIKAQEELCVENDDIIMLTRETGNFNEENGKMGGSKTPGSAEGHYTLKGFEALGKICADRIYNHIYNNIKPQPEKEMYLL